MWRIELVSSAPVYVPTVRELVEEYIRLPDAWNRSGGPPRQLPPRFREELAGLPQPAAPPGGDIAVAVDNRRGAFAVGLLVPHDEAEAEMKRIYVRPGHRRHGVGTAVTNVLVSVARELGYRSVVLDVMASRHGAVNMYERVGFVPIPSYREHPSVEMRAYRLAV